MSAMLSRRSAIFCQRHGLSSKRLHLIMLRSFSTANNSILNRSQAVRYTIGAIAIATVGSGTLYGYHYCQINHAVPQFVSPLLIMMAIAGTGGIFMFARSRFATMTQTAAKRLCIKEYLQCMCFICAH